MFRTEAQNRASRENGAKSHGPVTPDGKQTSARNATTHGLFSDSILLKPENRDAWNRMAQDLVARFRPAGSVELAVIHDMAVTQWRKERAHHIETALLDIEFQALEQNEAPATGPVDEIRRIAVAWANASGPTAVLAGLARQIIRFVNYWMRLHRKLKELQADRKAAEAKAIAEAKAAAQANAAAPPPPSRQKTKFEPGIVEISSFQRNGVTPAAGAEPPAADTSQQERPCTGK